MVKYVNGKCVPQTDSDYEPLFEVEPLSYKERVINRIRAVYSVDDEIAIIRQRDTKPEEFEEYNRFVEQVKLEEKSR